MVLIGRLVSQVTTLGELTRLGAPVALEVPAAEAPNLRDGHPRVERDSVSALPRRGECDGEDRRRIARRPAGKRIDGVELNEPAGEPEDVASPLA